MFTVTATFDLTILYFVAVNVVAILGYVLVLKLRSRRAQAEVAAIVATVARFFRETGSVAAVDCVRARGAPGYVVTVDTGASKRVRHSQVVEVILANHVRDTVGLVLHKVYWRFPINTAADTPTPVGEDPATQRIANEIDEYRSEGMRFMRDIPGYEVNEGSLEQYEEFVQRTRVAIRAARDSAPPQATDNGLRGHLAIPSQS